MRERLEREPPQSAWPVGSAPPAIGIAAAMRAAAPDSSDVRNIIVSLFRRLDSLRGRLVGQPLDAHEHPAAGAAPEVHVHRHGPGRNRRVLGGNLDPDKRSRR